MPKLNRNGEVCAGVAGGIVSALVSAVVQPGGSTQWLDDDTIIYACYRAAYGAWVIEQTNVRTGAYSLVDTRAVTALIAGGGRWVGYYADPTVGCFGAINKPAAGVAVAARDGTLAIVPNAQTGLGIILYGPNGEETRGPTEQPIQYGVNILSPTSCIWGCAGPIYGLNVASLPLQIGPAWSPFALTLNGELWICYWCDEYGLVLHPYNSLEGYVVEATPHAFWPDAIVVGNTIHIAYAWGQGDGCAADGTFVPSQIIHKTYTGAEARTTFTPSTSWFAPAAATRMFTGPTTDRLTGVKYPPLPHPVIDPQNGLATRPWAIWFQQIGAAGTDLAQQEGNLPRENLDEQPAGTLLGRGSATAGTPQVIRLGTGLEMHDTTLVLADDGASQDGWYEPLTTGIVATPDLIYALGDVITVRRWF